MLNKDEIRVLVKIMGIVFFALALYAASKVIGEPYSIFDYGRF